MWQFFRQLGVIDAQGQPTEHFGSPSWVYLQYCRRRNDPRPDGDIMAEAKTRIAEIRSRGVFIAEGFGDQPSTLQPALASHLQHIYDDAKVSIWKELDDAFVASVPNPVRLRTQSTDREDYILHPVSGEHLSKDSQTAILRLRDTDESSDTQIVISDGLNALAVMDGDQLISLVRRLRSELTDAGFRVSPVNLLVDAGRVRAGYRIGETLFGGRKGRYSILHMIGERPGTGHHTLSIYMTVADGNTWGIPDNVDHNITKVVSGIATTALTPDLGAIEAARILAEMRQRLPKS
jgi:ethanolamine ammonia-lyase large subunit